MIKRGVREDKRWMPSPGSHPQQIIEGDMQHFCQCDRFDIGDKPFAGFDALDGIFVDIQSQQLQSVGKFAL